MTFLSKFSRKSKFISLFQQILAFRTEKKCIYSPLFNNGKKYFKDTFSFQRLEFLGDAVLDVIITHFLYEKFPHENEGFLTRKKSHLVNRNILNKMSAEIDLLDIKQKLFQRFDKEPYKEREYGDFFEALIGALYIEKGYQACKDVVIKVFSNSKYFIEIMDSNYECDYKSLINTWVQKGKTYAEYEKISEFRKNKTDKTITIKLSISSLCFFTTGNSKKEAENNAAHMAYKKLMMK